MIASGRYKRYVYRALTLLLGLVLVVAAGFKGYELAYHGVPHKPFWSARPFLVSTVLLELAIGLLLMSNPIPRLTRVGAMVWFFLLFQVSLYQGLSGAATCGCMGKLGANLSPWYPAAFDFVVVVALFAFWPSDMAAFRSGERKRLVMVGTLFLCLAIPGLLAMTTYRRHRWNFTEMRLDPMLHRMAKMPTEDPTAAEVIDSVGSNTDLLLTVSEELNSFLRGYKPRIRLAMHETKIRGWAALELIQRDFPVPVHWGKTSNGYRLAGDDPWDNTKAYWAGGIALACCALLGLASVKK